MKRPHSDVAAAAPTSAVEKRLIDDSPFDAAQYGPTEKTKCIVVENFPALGKAAAFRFLEWAQMNPEGVCSLPTGKTPEFFIKWVQKILAEWDTPAMQKEVKHFGLGESKPQLGKLTFVQIDEFYPICPTQHNSFYHYVTEYYIKGFGLDPAKALLIDCSRIGLDDLTGNEYGLTGEPNDQHRPATMEDVWPDSRVDLTLRMREATSRIERVQQKVLRALDQWCAEYEDKIRALGGIGFFMGGIGPDGHVAFNCKGCAHHSTTRLDELNYESQAAAAGDLGGIEAVRKRKIITIGLGTITFNPGCVAITCAAGEAKAGVVRNAVQERPHVNYPATSLHKLPGAAFFVTVGAAKLLTERRIINLQKLAQVTPEVVQEVLVNLSIRTHKRLVDLTDADVASCPQAACVVAKMHPTPLRELAASVRDALIEKIERGSRSIQNTKFLHTEPHHDDIMLGYLPLVMRHTRGNSNDHHFVCGTSGFNSVSNGHMQMLLGRVEIFLKSETYKRLVNDGYFDVPEADGDSDQGLDSRRRDVWKFLDGVAADDAELRDEGAARRLISNLCIVYKVQATLDAQALLDRIAQLRHYFTTRYAGQKDCSEVQILKGSCREFEAECVWGYIGWQLPHISHLRLGFYTSDLFAPEPTHQRDVQPILKLLKKLKPDVVSVALDPEASGPDTHYKVLQAVTAAVEQHVEDEKTPNMQVWGYRNVWFRFDPHEVSTIVPVSLNSIAVLNHMFLSSFESQRDAEFPAYEIQGPFCAMSQRVQVQQYTMIETCLGYQWFHNHPSPLIRASRGLVFLKEMSVPELVRESRALRKQAENF